MSVEIRVPSLGESVTEATVAKWFKQIGEAVTADEPLVELETDKVTLEYNAPASGTLTEIIVGQGGEVEVGALLGAIDENASAANAGAAPPASSSTPVETSTGKDAPEEESAAAASAMSPAVRKLIEENNVDVASITPSGPKGNITKGDVLAAIDAGKRCSIRSSRNDDRPAGKPGSNGGRSENGVASRRRGGQPACDKARVAQERSCHIALERRRAGQDDQAQKTHRRTPERGAEYRSDPHHL